MAPELIPNPSPNIIQLVSYIESGADLGVSIGTGPDSDPYISPDKSRILKLYTRSPWKYNSDHLNTLFLYRDITNRASELVSGESWDIKSDSGHVMPISVVPVEHMYFSQLYKCVVNISPYIEGQTLSAIVANSGGLDLSLYKAICYERDGLSNLLNHTLNVKGIYLTLNNIKLIKRANDFEIVITDLCGEIDDLRLL